MRINVNLIPKDGYWFKESDGAIIRADKKWSTVIERVIAYRRRNKLPPGNPRAEVHAQACERNPNDCHPEQDHIAKAALKVASLKGRALAWMAGLRARREEVLWGDAQNAAARAQVCVGCPAHAAIAGGCGACKKALTEVRRDLMGDRPADLRLSGCSVLGEDCQVSVWIDQPTSDNPELPNCCWRKRL